MATVTTYYAKPDRSDPEVTKWLIQATSVYDGKAELLATTYSTRYAVLIVEALNATCPTMHEDELPELSDEQYKRWFDQSYVDGVRIGPRIMRG